MVTILDIVKPKLWEMDPHTKAKHEILEKYFTAWVSALANSHSNLLYVDGFAGPGEYKGGEPGSPLIVIETLEKIIRDRRSKKQRIPVIRCIFIELKRSYSRYLQYLLEQLNIPPEIKWEVKTGDFTHFSFQQPRNYPALFFIDPFGYSDIPMTLIGQLLSQQYTEVLINFMAEFVNRFFEREGQERAISGLFDSQTVWNDVATLGRSDRISRLHDVYEKALKQHAKFVRSFEMRGYKNVTKYYLFYGTNHKLGLEKMKSAMWHVDPSGKFQFSDATNLAQLVFFDDPDYRILIELIRRRFSGETISIETLESFVNIDTPFLITHLRRGALIPMEQNGEIVAIVTKRMRKEDYPRGRTRIKIIPSN